MRAARALALMAPDAGHSQHMTSHIFTALGMWDDVVSANEAAVQVQNAMRREKEIPERSWGHYNYWLLYGYLQQGRFEKARELLNAAYGELQADGNPPADPMSLDPDRTLVGSVVQMWARYVIETRAWDGEVANWTFKSGSAFDPNLTITFIRAIQAANKGLASEVDMYLNQFRKLKLELTAIVSRREAQVPTDLLYLDRLAVMEQEIQSSIEYARGNLARAVDFAVAANRQEGEIPFSFGPPFVDYPAAEFLGDILLASRRFSEAEIAYETQLERSRQKSRALLGLSMALANLEREAEMAYARQKLDRIWHDADDAVRSATSEAGDR